MEARPKYSGRFLSETSVIETQGAIFGAGTLDGDVALGRLGWSWPDLWWHFVHLQADRLLVGMAQSFQGSALPSPKASLDMSSVLQVLPVPFGQSRFYKQTFLVRAVGKRRGYYLIRILLQKFWPGACPGMRRKDSHVCGQWAWREEFSLGGFSRREHVLHSECVQPHPELVSAWHPKINNPPLRISGTIKKSPVAIQSSVQQLQESTKDSLGTQSRHWICEHWQVICLYVLSPFRHLWNGSSHLTKIRWGKWAWSMWLKGKMSTDEECW